jgi:hypothetical protein
MSDPRRQGSPGRDLLRLALETGEGSVRASGHPDENRLALYLSRELPADQAASVERHAAACAECAEVLAFAAVDESAAAATPGAASAADSRTPLRVVSSSRATGPKPGTGERTGAVEPLRGTASGAASMRRDARSTPRRSRFRAAASIALLLLAGGAATAGWLAMRWAGPVVANRSSDALEREVTTSGLSVAIAGGPGLRLEDVRIADDPRYSAGDFATASAATLQVDPTELLRGRLRGSVSVSDLVLRLVRGTDGTWNVETIGGERLASGRIDDDDTGTGPGAKPVAPGTIPPGAGNGRLRLSRTELVNGRILVADLGRGTELVLDRLALVADSPDAAKPATIALAGRVGEGGKVEVEGTAGPFLRGVPANYDLARVVLERVPAHSVPFLPAALTGDFSFRGKLASAGKRAKPILDALVGGGEVSVAAGRLDGANLARLLLAALDARLAAEGTIQPGEILPLVDAAATDAPAIAGALAAPSTALDRVSGPVEIGQRLLGTKDLVVSNGLLDALVTGTVDGDGQVRATGTALLSPALTRALLSVVPQAAAFGVREGRLELPFGAIGTWPDLRVAVTAPAR